MLVVDRIKLAVIDEILDVRHLDDCPAILLEQHRDAGHESVQIRHVGQYVVGDDHLRRLALAAQLGGQILREEPAERVDASLPCSPHGSVRRIDAQDRNAPVHEIPQKIPVVTGQFDNQAVRAEPTRFDQGLDVLPRVLQQSLRKRRVVRIVFAEELLRRHGLRNLHQAAIGTEMHSQWELRLHLGQHLFGKQSIRQWRLSQGKDLCKTVT